MAWSDAARAAAEARRLHKAGVKVSKANRGLLLAYHKLGQVGAPRLSVENQNSIISRYQALTRGSAKSFPIGVRKRVGK